MLLASFDDCAMLGGEFITSFRAASCHWRDPRDGATGGTLEERAVGTSFRSGWPRLHAVLIVGGAFDAATKLVTDCRRGRLMAENSWPVCELVGGSLRLDQASLAHLGLWHVDPQIDPNSTTNGPHTDRHRDPQIYSGSTPHRPGIHPKPTPHGSDIGLGSTLGRPQSDPRSINRARASSTCDDFSLRLEGSEKKKKKKGAATMTGMQSPLGDVDHMGCDNSTGDPMGGRGLHGLPRFAFRGRNGWSGKQPRRPDGG